MWKMTSVASRGASAASAVEVVSSGRPAIDARRVAARDLERAAQRLEPVLLARPDQQLEPAHLLGVGDVDRVEVEPGAPGDLRQRVRAAAGRPSGVQRRIGGPSPSRWPRRSRSRSGRAAGTGPRSRRPRAARAAGAARPAAAASARSAPPRWSACGARASPPRSRRGARPAPRGTPASRRGVPASSAVGGEQQVRLALAGRAGRRASASSLGVSGDARRQLGVERRAPGGLVVGEVPVAARRCSPVTARPGGRGRRRARRPRRSTAPRRR